MYLLCKVGWTDPHKIKTVMHPKPVISFTLELSTNRPLCSSWTKESIKMLIKNIIKNVGETRHITIIFRQLWLS